MLVFNATGLSLPRDNEERSAPRTKGWFFFIDSQPTGKENARIYNRRS